MVSGGEVGDVGRRTPATDGVRLSQPAAVGSCWWLLSRSMPIAYWLAERVEQDGATSELVAAAVR